MQRFIQTSDHRVAGSSPAGCMPYPEAVTQTKQRQKKVAYALCRFQI
jgi:hypothetical protein